MPHQRELHQVSGVRVTFSCALRFCGAQHVLPCGTLQPVLTGGVRTTCMWPSRQAICCIHLLGSYGRGSLFLWVLLLPACNGEVGGEKRVRDAANMEQIGGWSPCHLLVNQIFLQQNEPNYSAERVNWQRGGA